MRKLSLFLFLCLFGAVDALLADAACDEQCSADYWTCSDNCGPFGGSLCEQQCSDALSVCLYHCGQCPSTRDYSTTTVLSRSYTNRNGCYQDHLYLSGGRRYYEYYTKERKNNYRETTQCNGSKSTQLLSSSTYNYYCWVRGNTGADACSYPAPNYLFICY
jgi:hypothetical protein